MKNPAPAGGGTKGGTTSLGVLRYLLLLIVLPTLAFLALGLNGYVIRQAEFGHGSCCRNEKQSKQQRESFNEHNASFTVIFVC